MKKKIALLFAAAIFSITALMAQDGRQRMTPEERTKMTMEKMATLNLSADVKTKTEKIINDFYTAQQKAMQDMRASGSMDRDAMMATRKKLADERDAKLKEIFTQEQMKKWIDEIEPSLRPQRPAQN
ncbi:MAG: hypothetical protein JST02_07825 [Bacteroidetes bacterium]|nr:hypothetical protein [Bacteroidota bacterium]